MVEVVLWVRHPFPLLVEIPGRLSFVMILLDGALRQLRSSLPKNTSDLTAHLAHVYNTLTPTLDSYDGVLASTLNIRELVNDIGQLTSMLYGTAMQEGVEELRDCYNFLASNASAQSKAFTLTCKHKLGFINRCRHISSLETLQEHIS